MNTFRGIVLLSLLALLLGENVSAAETWEDERYQLSMQAPTDWTAMSKALLATTNAQVSHLTGRGFIAGYALSDTDTLVFPYMLVQFKPYTALPEQYRPKAKLDEHDQLGLLYALVGAFRQKGPLPETIDTPQFIDQFGNEHARLVRLDDDGRFDFTGKIPHEQGQEPIRYHTHGIPGRDGIALVSVFTVEGFSGLTYVIQNEMRTLKFAKGLGMDALPDVAPEPVEPAEEEPGEVPVETAQPQPIDEPVSEEPATETNIAPPTSEAEQPVEPANPSTGHADSGALVLILSLLGAVLFITILIVWFVTHQKAQAQRERRRARKERMLAAQSAAPVSKQPRPAAPPTARTHGSTDRQRHGTNRS